MKNDLLSYITINHYIGTTGVDEGVKRRWNSLGDQVSNVVDEIKATLVSTDYTAEGKAKALEEKGISVGRTPTEVGELVQKVL